MNWKYLTGKYLYKLEDGLRKLPLTFIRRNFPYGRHWMFDLQRGFPGQWAVIIDAGANTGAVSLELNRHFPESRIYAFEPVAATFRLLEKNTARVPHITAVCQALGSQPGAAEIFVSPEHTINSLRGGTAGTDYTGRETISVTRLDDFIRSQGLAGVDILKIDVEGFEFEVLAGCGALLPASIKCIYLEVGFEREPTKVHFSDVDNYMEKNGFTLCGSYETRRHMTDRRRLWYANQLYVRKDLLQ